VEFLVGVVSGAVLAATSGAMLYYGFVAWRNNQQAVELHRDGTAAMALLARTLREASTADVSVSGERVTAATQAFFRTGGNDLVHDPNTGVAGDEVVIVRGKAEEFTPVAAPTGLSVHLALQDGTERAEFDGAWAFRN
jgi:hypothetical protein